MRQGDLDAIDRHQRSRMVPWNRRAAEAIGRKFADARAHAERAVTETAKAAPDGRPTAALIRRSRSYQAACDRLAELLEVLAGPSVTSLGGIVRDAREAFYRDSFGLWKRSIPQEAWVSSDPEPTARGVRNARGQQIHGYELRSEIAGPIESAVADLGRAANAAASKYATGGDRMDLFGTWEAQRKRSVLSAVLGAVSDSDQRCHALACLDLIRPDMLAKEAVSASSHPDASSGRGTSASSRG